MWCRPDTGDAPTSYPAPTFSAVQGIFEAILWLQTAEVRPRRVEICAPLVYHRYTTNYGGPLRKSEQIRKGNNFQLIATVLVDVCYRLYAEVRGDSATNAGLSLRARRWAEAGVNGAHAYQEMFNRRLARGQFHHTPCLGWSEFLPSYLGPFRPETHIQEDLDLTLPSMLYEVFPGRKRSQCRPHFRQDVPIAKGVLLYAQ